VRHGNQVAAVPLVNNWWSRAVISWTREMFPNRRSIFVWGCLFVFIVGTWFLVKYAVWLAGIALITVLFIFTASYDLATYQVRKRSTPERTR